MDFTCVYDESEYSPQNLHLSTILFQSSLRLILIRIQDFLHVIPVQPVRLMRRLLLVILRQQVLGAGLLVLPDVTLGALVAGSVRGGLSHGTLLSLGRWHRETMH